MGPSVAFHTHTSSDIRASAVSGEGRLKKRQWCAESEPLTAVAWVRTEYPLVCVERARGAYRYENSCKGCPLVKLLLVCVHFFYYNTICIHPPPGRYTRCPTPTRTVAGARNFNTESLAHASTELVSGVG